MAPPLPPPCILFIKKSQIPIIKRKGKSVPIYDNRPFFSCGLASTATLFSSRTGVTSTPCGFTVTYCSVAVLMIIFSPSNVTRDASPFSTSDIKSEKGIVLELRLDLSPLKRLKSANINKNNTTQKAICFVLPT